MLPLSLLSLLLLGSVGEVTASVLFGRRQPPSDGAAPGPDRRQVTAVFTTFPTIFMGGDASRPRTAQSGFDIRVDLANDAWGFCGSNDPGQCDMAGTCVDAFACSRGCGFNTTLTTWTCSDSNARYCSTALLTLSSNSPHVFTYLACADKPSRTEEYKAFTTKPSTSSSSSSSPTPSATPAQTTRTTTTQGSSSTSTTPPPITSSSGNLASASTSTSSPAPSPDPQNNNTAMIVGAVVGCVALVCICVVVIFLIRRSRNAAAAAASAAAAANGGVGGPGGQDGAAALAVPPAVKEHKALLLPSASALELPGGAPAAYYYDANQRGGPMAGWGSGHGPTAAPVELPGAAGWAR